MPILRSLRLDRSFPASRRSAILALAVAFLVPAVPTSALAADGDLDPTFGSGGTTTTDFANRSDEALAVALQSDGKIVAAGTTRSRSSSSAFAVARYNTDGSLDPTFGDGGRVVTDFSGHGGVAFSVAVQPDGKIVVAGSSSSNGSTGDFAIARYLTNGSLDPDFGNGGMVTFDFAQSNDYGRVVAVLPDGKLVVAGAIFRSTEDFALVRFDADGTVDTSFGTNGKVTTDLGGGSELAEAITVQSDGAILLAGSTQDRSGAFRPALARYLADGTPDTSFGTAGRIVASIDDATLSFFQAVAVQEDGKILVSGRGGASGRDFLVVRYLPNGKLDTSFGGDGIVLTSFDGDVAQATALAIKPDGRIFAVGGTLHVEGGVITGGASVIAQYLPNGTLDPNFGDGGKLSLTIGEESQAYAAVLQPDGYLVIAGYGDGPTGSDDFALARIDVRPETDYSVSLDSPTLTVSRKDQGQISVNIARVGGFDGNVVVTAPDTSALKVRLAPAEASTTGGTVTFSYKVQKKAPRGSFPLVFKAVDDMGRERDVTLTLVIQ